MSEDETGARNPHPTTILCWLCDFQHVTEWAQGRVGPAVPAALCASRCVRLLVNEIADLSSL